MKKQIVIIAISILILTIVASFIGVGIRKEKQKREMSSLTEQERQEKEEENTIMNKIEDMSEVGRIQVYCGEFLKFIEQQRYEKAYECLNEDFKNNYFDSIEKFTEYVKNKYPKTNIAATYNKVDRRGEIFVLKVKISQVFNSEFESFEQRIVVKENGANNYKISFQVEPDEEGEGEKIDQTTNLE